MAEIYKMFANDWKDCVEFTDIMMIELYNQESYGGSISNKNGFALGKKWLSVNIAMWKDDIKSGHLFRCELYEDPKFPNWWLDSIFKNF